MIKIVLGGSPCTHWSIAQKNNRETEPSGMGWELFKNYVIAIENFKPDFFLYENNKSAAEPIKAKIREELKVTEGSLLGEDNGHRFTLINSALVSAQNRQRFYITNWGDIEQPEDRGILLKDILETGLINKEKAYCLKHQAGNARDHFKKHHTNIAFEPVCVAEPIDYAPRKGSHIVINENAIRCTQNKNNASVAESFVNFGDGKANTLTTVSGRAKCIEPLRNMTENLINGRGYEGIIEQDTGKQKPVYEVKDGQITIKDKQYPIKLADGFYIIRKLTVTECCRLQTMPDDYCRAVSATQGYKGLGNGWTAEVIMELFKQNKRLMAAPKDEKIVVCSMYDGIGTGRYVLEQLGFTNIEYHAYEIDKYAIQVAMSNFPDIIQHGDAFQVRVRGFYE